MTIATIVLAAGHGKRMKSVLPKILHPILNRPIILYALEAIRSLSDIEPVVVVGHGAEDVQLMIQQNFSQNVRFALQTEQLGTGHAVQQAQTLLQGKSDQVIVTFGDMPLLTDATLRQVLELHNQTGNVVTMASVIGDVPRGFGRVLRGDDGKVKAIVEEAVCTEEELLIREYNISAWCFEADWLWESLQKIKISPKANTI